MDATRQTNTEIARRWFEALNTGDLAIVEEIVDAAHVRHDPALDDVEAGPTGAKDLVIACRAAFPDIRFTVEDQIVEGDTVVTRWTGRGAGVGTHNPTYRTAAVTGIEIERIVRHKVVESWATWDVLGVGTARAVVPHLAGVPLS